MAASAAQSSRNLRGFIRWMRENNVEYSDGLSFHIGDTAADIGVKALYDLHVGEMIATIPKQACLTVVTTEAESMLVEAELGGGLGLAVALMYERSLGENSKWAAYLRLLPFQQSLPLVWSVAECDRLLTGTEIHKTIKEDRKLMKSDWKECYGILCDLFGEAKFPAKWFSLDHYLAAKTLVSSRAFEVDEFHGFGMVPLADLFNHKTGAEDVHFTSVWSDSDSDSEGDEPTTLGRVDETLEETPKKETKKRGKSTPTADESPKPREGIKRRGKSAPTADESPKIKEETKKRGKSTPTADGSPKPTEGIKKRGKSAPTADESPKIKEVTKKRGKSTPTADGSPKPTEETKKRGKSTPTADKSPKLEETPKATVNSTPIADASPKPRAGTKTRGKSTPSVDKSPKLEETPKETVKSTPIADESPKPRSGTKTRGKSTPSVDKNPKLEEIPKETVKSTPIADESLDKPMELTYKKRGKSHPTVVKEEPIEEEVEDLNEENGEAKDSAGSPSDWEGSSEVLEMIMVKDVAKGSEIYNTYGLLSNAALLHRYGFTEPDNPFDIINVDLALVIDVCGRLSSTRHVRRCLTLWKNAGCAPCSSQGSEYFEISVDGRPQPELLVLLYLFHVPDANRDKLEKQAVDWNADEVELSDDEEIERISSAAVDKLAKALGWTSKLKKDSSSRKRSRDDQATPSRSSKRATPQRTSVTPREEDPSWITDLDKWLLTKLVCTSLLAIVTERDSMYPEVSLLTSEKLVGGPPNSTLEEDRSFLQSVDSKSDAKLYHALSLRVGERTILDKCATIVKMISKKR